MVDEKPKVEGLLAGLSARLSAWSSERSSADAKLLEALAVIERRWPKMQANPLSNVAIPIWALERLVAGVKERW